MKSLIIRNGIGLLVLTLVFCLFSSVASASKLEMYEIGERIKELDMKIDRAYEDLRKLNEEGGAAVQEEAQVIMSLIKEMKAEKQALQSSLAKLKNGNHGHNSFRSEKLHDSRRDVERLAKLSKR